MDFKLFSPEDASAAWPGPPDHIKAAINALVQAHKPENK